MKKFIPALAITILSSSIMTAYASTTESSIDCTDEEINAYMDQSGFKKKRAFNTIPNTDEYIKAEIERKKIEEGAEADDCLTIFDEGVDTSKADEVLTTIKDFLNDPIGGLSKAGDIASERIGEMYEETTKQMKKGICDRLSTESVTDSVGDEIDKIYKEETKDTALYGTRVNSEDILTNGGGIGGSTVDPSEAIGKNFTYQIIKNQLGKNSGYIARILDISNPNQAGVISDAGGDILDDNIDALEDSIFGD